MNASTAPEPTTTDGVVHRLRYATPYGLEDYTLLADAAATIERLQQWAADITRLINAMGEAGDRMHAFLSVNASTTMQAHPDWSKIMDEWEATRV